jgi:hypothetical protein
MPPGAPAKASLVRVCANGTKDVDVSGALGLRLVFDAANTVTNLGYAEVVDRPKDCGHPVTWSGTPPGVEPDGVDACVDTADTYRALVSVQWRVEPGEHRVYARCEHGCFEGSGPVEIASVVRIGLDVTDEFGTGGPDGDLDDPGDNLGSYLPGEIPAGPMIKWDERGNRLIPQRLSLLVETKGDVPYTNAVFLLLGVTETPGWCTNTREPGDKDSDEAVANWDPHDFSLSEAGYLSQTNAPIVDGVAAVDLFCRDYGGSCRVRVELPVTNGVRVVREFHIPLDTDTDLIADCWEINQFSGWNAAYATNEQARLDFFATVGGRQELRDPDGPAPLAAHAAEGDGLGNFDEYRGVALPSHALKGNPVHLRLSPARKEILVEMHVAAGGGTNATVTGTAAHAMDAGVTAFRDTLGIDLLWYVGGFGIDVEVDAGNRTNTIDAVERGLKATSPFWADRSHARCIVFGGDVFPSDPNLYGMASGDATVLIGCANIAAAWSGTGPGCLFRFFEKHGIGLQQFFDSAAVHELGHTVDAGESGGADTVVLTAQPVLTVKVKSSYEPGDTIEWSLRDGTDPGAGIGLRVSKAPYSPSTCTNAFEASVLGDDVDEHPTVGQLRDALNAHGGFVASCTGADAARCAHTLERGTRVIPRGDVGIGIAAEAAVNGIMTYNLMVPERYATPRFHNGAVQGDPPDSALLPAESGSVRVRKSIR